MSIEAMSHHSETILTLRDTGLFERWVAIDDPWKPDLRLYSWFGYLTDRDGQITSKTKRNEVRCSPRMRAFMLHHTAYKHPLSGPDPEQALDTLLKCCFVSEHLMFHGANCAYELLINSHMVLDMAFIRAVLLASQWLGDSMPAGRIQQWPPKRVL